MKAKPRLTLTLVYIPVGANGILIISEVTCTRPEGGMFLWAELPRGLAALDLFDLAVKDKVVFVPGDPFYVRGQRHNTLRLNFSCADEATIETGIERLGRAIGKLIKER